MSGRLLEIMGRSSNLNWPWIISCDVQFYNVTLTGIENWQILKNDVVFEDINSQIMV